MDSATLQTLALAAIVVSVGLVIARKNWGETNSGVLVTGLRVIDVFVPLPSNRNILLTGDPQAGTTNLANELAWRLLHDPKSRHHVAYYLDARHPQLEEKSTEVNELLPTLCGPVVSSRISDADLLDELDRSLCKSLVVFVATDDAFFLQTAMDAVQRARDALRGSRKLTFIAVAESVIATGFDAVVGSSRSIAAAGVYPAVDLTLSSSSLCASGLPADQQVAVNRAAIAIRSVGQSLYVGAVEDAGWAYNSQAAQRPCLQALCFISQAYFIAEPFTGKKAARISVGQAVNGFAEILSGSFSHLPANRFLYQNSLPSSASATLSAAIEPLSH